MAVKSFGNNCLCLSPLENVAFVCGFKNRTHQNFFKFEVQLGKSLPNTKIYKNANSYSYHSLLNSTVSVHICVNIVFNH